MTRGESQAWRPIVNAPHDEAVLVYSLRWGAIVATFASESGEWRTPMRYPASLSGRDAALITHWMPMPGVPAELTRSRSPWLSLAA
jgi:hypothetical protein